MPRLRGNCAAGPTCSALPVTRNGCWGRKFASAYARERIRSLQRLPSLRSPMWMPNYVKLAERMMTSGVFCGIATHDEAIVEKLLAFVRERDVPEERLRVPDALRDPT